jgi:hypothetical protein
MGRSTYCLGLLLAATALMACGGSQPAANAPGEPAATPPGETPAAEAPGGGGELVWKDDMPTKDKAEFMKKKVLPAMSKTFQEYDAKKYEKFSCKTCHGADMKPKPVDALPELHFKAGKLTEADTNPDIVKFMHEKVAPGMADIFGKKPYDPATKEGFGCNGCHKVNM